MKKIISLVLVLTMALSLMACGGGKATTEEITKEEATTEETTTEKTTKVESNTEGVTISILSRYGDDTAVDAKAFRQGIEEYKKAHPEVTVVDESITDETQFNSKFKITMATGDMPTIFMTYGGGTAKSYVESGLVADLTSYFDNNQEWYDTFLPSMFDMISFDGIEGVYGVPYAAYADSLFCNKAMFDEYGIKIPTTIEEFEVACEKFLENGIVPLPIGDKSTFRGGHLFTLLMAKRSGNELAVKLANRETTYSDEAVKDILTTMKSWADKGYLGDSITTLDGEGECQLFLTAQSPMDFRNAYFIGRVTGEMENPDDVVNVSFPYYEEYPEYQNAWHGGSGDIFSISALATEAEKEAAIELLKTCTQAKYMEQRNIESSGGFVSVLKDNAPIENQPQITTDFKANFAKMESLLTEPAEYDSNSGLRDATRTGIQAMWAGDSIEAVIESIQTIIETE
ncbi:MAG: extracellular solute-binding protein [Anaerocolumna sp.]